jgi:protein-S-isoprenylcysteine O-methyltransferase Ste14
MSPERSGPRGLELKLPPVVVAALAGLAMLAIDRLLPSLRLASPILDTAVLVLTVLGVSIALGAMVSFHRARTTIDPRTPDASARLIRTGLFAWSRNPIYLAMALLLLAYAARLGHPVAALMVPAFMAWIQRFQIRPEERSLEALFGAPYRDYCRRVRRWL